MADIAVETRGLSKSYGAVQALRSVDLRIEAGSYFVLLGPSGGGKSTLLGTVGGFIRPTEGRVLLHGRDVTDLPPNKRLTSMVFQSYALFPHMSVERNVGYGLKLKRMAKSAIAERVGAMLELVGLSGYQKRMPHELSGGQQQRVQLARSLVLESDVLLLDEPLASLDAKLRKEMCIELKHIQEKLGITFVHVTHNQDEAMTVGDRIALIADGEVIEQGPPREVYERPRRRFTAEFIGDNNLLDGKVAGVEPGAVLVDLGYGVMKVPALEAAVKAGDPVSVSLRSELMQILPEGAEAVNGMQALPATFAEQLYLGLTTSNLIRMPDGKQVLVRVLSNGGGQAFEPGQAVKVAWSTDHARLHVA